MGCCCSSNAEDIYEDPQVNDRTNLLGNPVAENSRTISINNSERIPSLTGRVDEQAKLNKILHDTASSYIDVPALNSPSESLNYHGMERTYAEKVRQILEGKNYKLDHKSLLSDQEQVEQVLSTSPLSLTDKKLVDECSSQILDTMSTFRVNYEQSIIIPFSGQYATHS